VSVSTWVHPKGYTTTGYGVSPGNKFVAEPYAYVNPPSARAGGFWNTPFGARPMRELDDAGPDAVLAFFAEARRRSEEDPPA
jgi:hypothetical protein